MEYLLQFLLILMAAFLILIILVQRGRGGGLAGALGGPGGSSAFGAKAGDAFTKITMYAAIGWFVLCIIASVWGGGRDDSFSSDALSGIDRDRPKATSSAEKDDLGAAPAAESENPAAKPSNESSSESEPTGE